MNAKLVKVIYLYFFEKIGVFKGLLSPANPTTVNKTP